MWFRQYDFTRAFKVAEQSLFITNRDILLRVQQCIHVAQCFSIALFLTGTLLRDRVFFGTRETGEADAHEPMIAAKLYCPEWRAQADGALGLVGSDSSKRLDIVTCDLLPEGETCDRVCLEAIA